jgi:hypothetical protein
MLQWTRREMLKVGRRLVRSVDDEWFGNERLELEQGANASAQTRGNEMRVM